MTLLTVDFLGMDDTTDIIAKRYLEYCSKSPKPMKYVTRFGNKETTRKKRVGKVIVDCASSRLQAVDQIDPHEHSSKVT